MPTCTSAGTPKNRKDKTSRTKTASAKAARARRVRQESLAQLLVVDLVVACLNVLLEDIDHILVVVEGDVHVQQVTLGLPTNIVKFLAKLFHFDYEWTGKLLEFRIRHLELCCPDEVFGQIDTRAPDFSLHRG